MGVTVNSQKKRLVKHTRRGNIAIGIQKRSQSMSLDASFILADLAN